MACPCEHYPEGHSCRDIALGEGSQFERAEILIWLQSITDEQFAAKGRDGIIRSIKSGLHVGLSALGGRDAAHRIDTRRDAGPR